jgi:hypothetical protein
MTAVSFYIFSSFVLGANPDDVPKIPKQKIQSEKCLVLIIWGSTGVKGLLYVSKCIKYNTSFFVESVIPDLVEHFCQQSRGKTLRGIMVHLDDARAHNSKKSKGVLTTAKAR